MRYALTYSVGDWLNTDTIIIDTERSASEGGGFWFDDETRVADVLSAYGLDSEQTADVINNNRWFIRNCDDVDFSLTAQGELYV